MLHAARHERDSECDHKPTCSADVTLSGSGADAGATTAGGAVAPSTASRRSKSTGPPLACSMTMGSRPSSPYSSCTMPLAAVRTCRHSSTRQQGALSRLCPCCLNPQLHVASAAGMPELLGKLLGVSYHGWPAATLDAQLCNLQGCQ